MLKLIPLAVLIWSLTACGGGGGSSSSPKPAVFDASAIAGTYDATCSHGENLYGTIYYGLTVYPIKVSKSGLVTGFESGGIQLERIEDSTLWVGYRQNHGFRERLELNFRYTHPSFYLVLEGSGGSWAKFEVVDPVGNG